MIISIHVPKCAGTSFRNVLQKIFGRRLWSNYGTVFTREQARPDLVPVNTVCIHGHFFADAFSDLYPQARLITWIRHPVERVLSNYHFFRRHPEVNDGCCQALHQRKLSVREFADLDWMRNETTRYLAGRPLSDFDFVGVTERFSDSLGVFESEFGLRPPAVRTTPGWPGSQGRRIPWENSNPERTSPVYPLSPEDHAYILRRNLADYHLYEEAVQRLEGSLAPAADCFAYGA
jgi:hypothetical protein